MTQITNLRLSHKTGRSPWRRILIMFIMVPSILTYSERKVPLKDQSTFAHNTVRDLHNVQRLIWDQGLGSGAQKHADDLALKNSFEHSQESNEGLVGENVYKAFDGFLEENKIADAVYLWYLEILHYDFNNPTPDLFALGHFTAVVWRETSHVGCGVSTRKIYGGLMTYVVCQYLSVGNVADQFLSNVLPLRQGGVIPGSPNDLQLQIGCWDVYEQCHVWLGVCTQESFRNLMLQYCKKTCNLC